MDSKLFAGYLQEMAQKYSIAAGLTVAFEEGAVLVDCDKGAYRFFYHFGKEPAQDGRTNVPLLHWRNNRKYVEIRNVLAQSLVEKPLALRIHHVVAKDELTNTLADILAYEADLIAFVTGQKVDKIFADYSGERYVNCIASAGGIKASLEIGFLPQGSEPVLLHEVIAKTGIVSDVVVDTQVTQYPVSVFKGDKTETYNDIDFELYGLAVPLGHCVRFILAVLADTSRIPALCDDFAHLRQAIRAAENSGAQRAYAKVEG